ncbi:MAG: glycosyltransferase family 2 protein [Clostridia bacterium]
MNDLISVIIPVYKVEKYLEQCISSVIRQTYRNLEIILVDDGSPDNCPKICDEYAKKDNRIRVIHKKNGGVSSARNIGIDKAKGKWIAFIDSDDWVEENYIERLHVCAVKENADIALCGYNRIIFNKIEKINSSGKINRYSGNQYLTNSLNPQTGFGLCHMKLINRKIIKNIRFDESLEVGEDALFNIMITKNIKCAVNNNESLYNYRINTNSVVRRFDEKYDKKYLDSMLKCKRYLDKEYCNNKEIMQNYYNYVAYHVMLVSVNYCFNPDNNITYLKKVKSLREICQYSEFKDGIEKSNYNNISRTRQITLFTLKHKLYFITSMICICRQKQNRKRGKV